MSVPKLNIVVSPLKRTPLAVLVCRKSVFVPEMLRMRWTIWIPLSTPSPRRRGRAIILAKLKDAPMRTVAAPVKRPATSKGIKTRRGSAQFLKMAINSTVISNKALRKACLKE